MIELPFVTVVFVTLAAIFYCREKTMEIIETSVKAYVNRHLKAIESLHDDTYQEIRTEFDFWWSGEPSQRARESMLKKIALSQEVPEVIPDEVLDLLVAPQIKLCRAAALHLAAHARMRQQEDALHEKLPRLQGLRNTMLLAREKHERDLDGDKAQLLEMGVDIGELESRFASAE